MTGSAFRGNAKKTQQQLFTTFYELAQYAETERPYRFVRANYVGSRLLADHPNYGDLLADHPDFGMKKDLPKSDGTTDNDAMPKNEDEENEYEFA